VIGEQVEVATKNIVVHVFESTLDSMRFLSGNFPSRFSIGIFGRSIMDSYWDKYTVFSPFYLPQNPSFSFQAGIDTEKESLGVVRANEDRSTQEGLL
jgi:hypothetical protein